MFMLKWSSRLTQSLPRTVVPGGNGIKHIARCVSSSQPLTQQTTPASDQAEIATLIPPRQRDPAVRAKLIEFGRFCGECLPKFIQKIQVTHCDELELLIAPQGILPVIAFLKGNHTTQFTNLSDIAGMDVPSRINRFEVIYNLLSINFNSRIRVRTYTDEFTPIDSLVELFPAAEWYEREVYDLYGVFFLNHPDLRRILTDYGFMGHPFRKDFPLTGYSEYRFDTGHQMIIEEPLELAQEFRRFDLETPWEVFPESRAKEIAPEEIPLMEGKIMDQPAGQAKK
ncbi:NADH:ubiquinone oxidoreductase core subunit S3 [Brevipalpus obovatus]|uniref:NADH:ubiquinone oxidoreductase core subunit S3 n=1 Tax=Brevipalpus obovatus TaxID=246614 RepID=UPI003D9E8491